MCPLSSCNRRKFVSNLIPFCAFSCLAFHHFHESQSLTGKNPQENHPFGYAALCHPDFAVAKMKNMKLTRIYHFKK